MLCTAGSKLAMVDNVDFIQNHVNDATTIRDMMFNWDLRRRWRRRRWVCSSLGCYVDHFERKE